MIKQLGSFLLLMLCLQVFAQVDAYDWLNAPIGGGGYITGVKIHPLDANKRFYRTDVGGAYRWDANTQRMEQMIFMEGKSFYSVAGIALHPTNTNELYLAVGRYCDTAQSAILKSTDGGVSFTELNITGGIPFYFAANGGRDCPGGKTDPINPNDKDREGTPLAIDPFEDNLLYVGTREKGLWYIDLNTGNATQVNTSQIPENTNYRQITSVVFHPTDRFVYVGYPGYGVFIGNTQTKNFWNLDYVGGADYPDLLEVIDMSISKDGDYMLVACRQKGVYKCSNITASVSWQQLSGGLIVIDNNAPGEANNRGYLTVSCSPHNNLVAVTVAGDWNHINQFQTTTNAGANWSTVAGSVPPATHIFPWRYEAFGNHVSQIAFDPSNASKMHFTSWFSTFQSDNWSPSNGGTWKTTQSAGHEEIVGTDLVSFPSNGAGNFLMAGSGDHSGFIFDNSIEDPNAFRQFDIKELVTDPAQIAHLGAPRKIKKSCSFAFCESQPDHLAAILTDEWNPTYGALLVSDDGGASWDVRMNYPLADKKSLVEFSSNDPQRMIFLNNNALRYSTNGGFNFLDATGTSNSTPNCTLPQSINCIQPSIDATTFPSTEINQSVFGSMRNITADKNFGCVFYWYNRLNGTFNISVDDGETWCVTNNTPLPVENDKWNKTRVISIPNQPGHLWINIKKTLYFSDDFGETWTNKSTSTVVDDCFSIGFGAGYTNAYPALYMFGTLDGTTLKHFYRSDDGGTNWIRISEHNENEVWGDNRIVVGDRNIPGRVYAIASGQGVVFGEKDVPISCDNQERLLNSTFDTQSNNIPNWAFHVGGAASATGYVNANDEAVLNVSTAGSNDYHVQMWQDNLGFEANQAYVIKTKLRAAQTRAVTLKLRNKTNGTTYLEHTFDVSNTSQEYAFVFTAPQTDNDLRLTLMVGNSTHNVYVDDISLKEFCDDGTQNTFNCVDYLRVDNPDIDAQDYQADKELRSAGQVLTTDDVNFSAGEAVILETGFEADSSSNFRAFIEQCP